MSFPRYERYKDSGVGWLGLVPGHWQTTRLRSLFEIKKRIVGELGPDVLSITQQGIRVKDVDANEGQLSSDYSKYQIVDPGDFAMNHMDLLTGYIDIAQTSGVTSPDYRVFSSKRKGTVEDRFFLYVFQNAYKQSIFYGFGQGASHFGRWRLPTDEFNNFIVPVPSLEEQAHIVAVLDQETAKIDALIEEQRRLIELLKEKRQAVISHAVSCGLHSTAEMSEVHLAVSTKIPVQWSVVPLRSVIFYQEGPGILAPDFREEGVPLLRLAGTQGKYISRQGCNYIDPDWCEKRFPHFKLKEGDLVISASATMGTACEVGPDGEGAILYTGLIRIRVREAVLKPYVKLWLLSHQFSTQVDLLKSGSTIQHFGPTHMDMMRMALPPLEDQKEIVSVVERQLAVYERLATQAQIAVDLLQERRSALISAAVTGKIDVRNYAQHKTAAPEETYELA